MENTENKLFRKSALDRISSPEQLNEYMKVTGAGVWFILAGLAVTFAAFFLWGITGSIPETVDITGTVISRENWDEFGDEAPMLVYCYLPVEYNKLIMEGLEVRVSPNYAPREQYGYMYGKIVYESASAIDLEELRLFYGPNFDLLTIPDGNIIEVIIQVEKQDGRPVWSTFRGNSVDVIVGSTCQVTVITGERRPIELMFR